MARPTRARFSVCRLVSGVRRPFRLPSVAGHVLQVLLRVGIARCTTRSRGNDVTTRSWWLGVIRTASVRPDWTHRRRAAAPAVHSDGPAQRTGGQHESQLDDGFRDLLAHALIARHRARITEAPELMLLRETWDGAWARAEADQLMIYLRPAIDQRMVGSEGDGQRILQEAAT